MCDRHTEGGDDPHSPDPRGRGTHGDRSRSRRKRGISIYTQSSAVSNFVRWFPRLWSPSSRSTCSKPLEKGTETLLFSHVATIPSQLPLPALPQVWKACDLVTATPTDNTRSAPPLHNLHGSLNESTRTGLKTHESLEYRGTVSDTLKSRYSPRSSEWSILSPHLLALLVRARPPTIGFASRVCAKVQNNATTSDLWRTAF